MPAAGRNGTAPVDWSVPGAPARRRASSIDTGREEPRFHNTTNVATPAIRATPTMAPTIRARWWRRRPGSRAATSGEPVSVTARQAPHLEAGQLGRALEHHLAALTHHAAESTGQVLEVGVDVASLGWERDGQHVWLDAGAVPIQVDLVAPRPGPDGPPPRGHFGVHGRGRCDADHPLAQPHDHAAHRPGDRPEAQHATREGDRHVGAVEVVGLAPPPPVREPGAPVPLAVDPGTVERPAVAPRSAAAEGDATRGGAAQAVRLPVLVEERHGREDPATAERLG